MKPKFKSSIFYLIPKQFRFYYLFLISLPFFLLFSYHPVILISKLQSLNLELSLPFIWLILFSIFSLKNLQPILQNFQKTKTNLIFLLLPIYLTLSLLWTKNFLRGFLVVVITWLLFFSLFSFYYFLQHKNIQKYRQKIFHHFFFVLIFSAVFASIFSWLQSFLDILGIPRDISLMCQGCVYHSFGFPHPNAFAIEPQFFGNQLLLPSLLLIFAKIYPKSFPKLKYHNFLTIFLITTLFFTFSRGAIFSFILASSLISLVSFFQHTSNKSFLPIVISLGFIISLIFQGFFSVLSPTNTTFFDGVSTAINHLTLDKINLKTLFSQQTPSSTKDSHSNQGQSSSLQNQPLFSGYVADSTDIRLRLSNLSIFTWLSSPNYFFFGSGIGSAGVAIFHQFKDLGSPKEIVQNQYLSLLLETGIIGISIIILSLSFIIKRLFSLKTENKTLFFSLALAFLFSLNFFSGLPNALHIYFLLPLLFFFRKN